MRFFTVLVKFPNYIFRQASRGLCLRTLLLFSLPPFTVYCGTQTDSKDHHCNWNQEMFTRLISKGHGVLPLKILLADSHFVRKCVLVNNSRLLRYFSNVFLETVVKIAMIGLTWKRKKNKKIGPLRSTVSLNSNNSFTICSLSQHRTSL